MAKLPFMKFYHRDWFMSTRTMSYEMKGRYIDLLCYIWDQGELGYVSPSKEELDNLWTTSGQEAVEILNKLKSAGAISWYQGMDFIGITQERIREDLMALKKDAKRQRINRKQRPPSVHKMSSENPQKKSEVRSQKADNKTPISPFEPFWQMYPRKVGKQPAMKAWNKINPDEELTAKIMMALANHRKLANWNKDNGEFIPHAATWLNQRRWEDDIGHQRTITNRQPNIADKYFRRKAEEKKPDAELGGLPNL